MSGLLDLAIARYTAAGAQRVYEPNDVPAGSGYPYAVVSVDTGRGVNRRSGGAASRKVRSITVEIHARSEDAALDYADMADAAFEDKVLAEFPDKPFSIRDVASSLYRDPDDDGVLRLVHIYQFT